MAISEESLSTSESDNKDSDLDIKGTNSFTKYSPSIRERTKVDGMYE